MTSANQISDPKPATKFLFVGNGPYRNRGCEAIVRGTMEILTETFGEIQASAGVMASPETVAAQQQAEIDSRVTNFSVSHVGPRFSLKWWMAQANKRLRTEFQQHTFDLRSHVSGLGAAMQLGGDNYSLDYGRPLDYMAVDRFLQKKGIPVYIWGASVGPFDQDEEFAPVIHQHLKTLNGIFVRETATQSYLAKHGITDNVHLVADPAFVMKPLEPADLNVQALVANQPIGINISPLVARFSSAGGLDAWRDKAVEMVVACAKRTDKPILLIPHVASPKHDEDDYAFMASLQAKVSQQVSNHIGLVPPLGAAELKWLIARCCVFAGARTHATIAALSSGVPTLSLSYSVKAIGINQDVFGHQEFCHSVKSISPEQFALAVDQLVSGKDGIRALIESRLPAICDRATNAGRILRGLVSK
ncbi:MULTISPECIES: polysaccharide pyruvyl transferase family protein [unclassified Limnobacter]|uniref:polysaccharide pyruvyl transferase family protein n=1 Tax=unclassified Limnobacter TaxID=2630203 RepID=UPI000C48061D|nr:MULTISPECIES: polysaccharide pyruvyl transferase family protein [unclassified Limnobacter]MAZ08556.1 hypothetical protein [Sutterellaceae bacterium]